MKILIINYFYPPVGGAHSYRWQQISTEWQRQGHDITFISSKATKRPVGEGVKLIEAGSTVSVNRFTKKLTSSLKLKEVIINKVKEVVVYIYRKFYWPDGLWYWLVPLMYQLIKIKGEKFDLIVTYSPSFSAHIGGLFFKSINNHKFKWIVDYGDPFSLSYTMPPNNLYLFNKLNHYIEKSVLSKADVSVFTNKATLTAYKEVFGSEQYMYIPHAVDINTFYKEKGCVGVKLETIRLCYVGGFHKSIREPYKALELIKKVIRKAKKENLSIVFDIYGPTNGLEIESLMSDSILYHGPVDRDVAVCLMKKADILVNIENMNCTMTPSKIVEYIATGLPIINFYDDKISSIFTDIELNEHIIMVNGSEGICSILEFIKSKHKDQLSKATIDSILEDFSVSAIGSRYLQVVK